MQPHRRGAVLSLFPVTVRLNPSIQDEPPRYSGDAVIGGVKLNAARRCIAVIPLPGPRRSQASSRRSARCGVGSRLTALCCSAWPRTKQNPRTGPIKGHDYVHRKLHEGWTIPGDPPKGSLRGSDIPSRGRAPQKTTPPPERSTSKCPCFQVIEHGWRSPAGLKRASYTYGVVRSLVRLVDGIRLVAERPADNVPTVAWQRGAQVSRPAVPYTRFCPPLFFIAWL